MDRVKRIVLLLLDIVEIHIPTVCMAITFGAFIVQIFSRYVFRAQVGWSYELTLIGFLWCLILAAPNGSRTHTHVTFTLFYDKLGEGGQLALRLFGELFVIVAFGMLAGPAWEFIDFMSIKRTSVTKLPMNILFFPFIVFTLLTLAHTVKDLVGNLRLLYHKLAKKEGDAR